MQKPPRMISAAALFLRKCENDTYP